MFAFAALYSFAFYSLGKSSLKTPPVESVKGVSTEVQGEKLLKPQPYSDEQQAEVIPETVNNCSNSTYGFEVNYPKDWFTTYNNDPQKCLFFAPYSFVVPQLTDSNFVPVTITPVKVEDWQSTVIFYENPNDLENITSVKNVEINSMPVTIVEAKSTGDGSTPKGYITTSYLVLSNKWPLVITYTQQDSSDDTLKYQGVISDMVQSLQYF